MKTPPELHALWNDLTPASILGCESLAVNIAVGKPTIVFDARGPSPDAPHDPLCTLKCVKVPRFAASDRLEVS